MAQGMEANIREQSAGIVNGSKGCRVHVTLSDSLLVLSLSRPRELRLCAVTDAYRV